MNPLDWLRWKVLVVLLMVGGALYLLGLNPLARWQINSTGDDASAARWRVSDIGLGVLSGDFEVLDILVASVPVTGSEEPAPAGVDESERIFNADNARLNVNVTELMRRRLVVDEIGLSAPRMEVRRRPDGTTNIPGAESPEAAEDRTLDDWLDLAKEWYERLEELRKKLPPDEPREGEDIDYYSERVRFPFEDRPTVVVRRIVADDLDVLLSDETREGAVARIEKASIALTGLSSSPAQHDEPIALRLDGSMAGSPLSLVIHVDLTGPVSDYGITLKSGSLPVEAIEALVGASLPVRLSAGRVGLDAVVGLKGDGTIELAPKLLFQGVQLATKPGEDEVAGVDAGTFVKAFNEASRYLGEAPIEIADLRIDGTLDAPRFHWGDTVQKLVVEGGKAFADAQLKAAEDRVRAEAAKLQGKIDEETAKLEGKIDEEAAKLQGKLGPGLEKVIGGEDGEGGAQGALKGVLRGLGGDKTDGQSKSGTSKSETGGGAVEKATDSGLDAIKKGASGLFGGSGKDD